ncbi:MAG: ribose-phosphate diphosphokinase [Candidatus Hydrothermarchaeota archaeon]
MFEIIVIGGTASQRLSAEVASLLSCDILRVKKKHFPDGELYIKIERGVKDEDVILIQSTHYPQVENTMELIFLLDLLSDYEPNSMRVFIPYLGFSRQDKRFEEGEVISVKAVAKMISHFDIDLLYLFDVHKPHIIDFFNVPVKELSAISLLASYIKDLNIKDLMVIAPDRGALKKARDLASILEIDFDYLEKERVAPGIVKMKEKDLNVKEKNIVLIDDIIDSGGTIIEASEFLFKRGAKKIIASCIHPVLSRNALSKILACNVSDLIATNSIEREVSKVSLAPLIANEIS